MDAAVDRARVRTCGTPAVEARAMSAWPFEPIADARRRLEVQRTRMMAALAAWTSGAGSYDEVCASIESFEAQLASFKDVIHGLRDEPGVPRRTHSRFDDDGNITPPS